MQAHQEPNQETRVVGANRPTEQEFVDGETRFALGVLALLVAVFVGIGVAQLLTRPHDKPLLQAQESSHGH